MEQIELLERAKSYMDCLAQGFDPVSGEELPDDTVLNNVRLARCFFYVAGVLQKVADNGGVIGKRPAKEKAAPFAITKEELSLVEVTEEPAYISHFCRRVSDAAQATEKNMKPLSHRVLTDWMEQKGLINTVIVNNKKHRRVTPAGERAGLAEVEGQGANGHYIAITYNAEAQRFLLGNLEEILVGEE